MNAGGTNQKDITNNPADDKDPDWCCQTFQPTESTRPGSDAQAPSSPETASLHWSLVILIISLVVIATIFMNRKIILRKE
jgi:hypothetical protein